MKTYCSEAEAYCATPWACGHCPVFKDGRDQEEQPQEEEASEPRGMSDNDPRWPLLEFILKMPSVCWLALVILAWFAVVGRGCIRYNP